MTGDEVERLIELVLKNKASLEIQLERTDRQIKETNQRFEMPNKRRETYAQMQAEFIQVITRHIEVQTEINTSLHGAMLELAAAQMQTEARLDRLAETVERFITEGRNGKS